MKKSLIYFAAMIILLSCSEPTNTNEEPKDFKSILEVYLASELTFGGVWNPGSLNLFGYKDLRDSIADSLSGFVFVGLRANSNDFINYHQRTGKPYVQLFAIFKSSNDQLNFDYYVAFNGLDLTKEKSWTYPSYQLPSTVNDSSFEYNDKFNFKITTPENEVILDSSSFPNDLLPIQIAGATTTNPQLDTIRLSQGMKINWGNPDTNTFISINFYYNNYYSSGYVRAVNYYVDDGEAIFTQADLANAGIPETAYVTIHITRYKYNYNKLFASGTKRLGFFTFSRAAMTVFTKP